MSSSKRRLIEQLARKYNLPETHIEKAVSFQFKYVADIIREGNFDAVRLPYFGIFKVNPGRLRHLQNTKTHKKRNK